MEPTTWTEVWTKIIIGGVGLLVTYTTLMAPVIIKSVKDWINARRDEARTGVELERAQARQKRIEDIVMMAVNATTQTFTGTLKAKAADGKLTFEEAGEAFSKTITTARKHLIASGIDESSEILEDYIEEAVARLK